jgi:predicted GIY-YIG superfamily endonuclease
MPYVNSHPRMSTIPKLSRESMDAGIHVSPLCYVLECQPSVKGARPNYYVGISLCSLHSRLAQHWSGRGSKWTRLHPPIRIHSVRWGGTDIERKVTIEMARIHGAEYVRGGPWCQSPPPVRAGALDSDLIVSSDDDGSDTSDSADSARGRADRATTWRRSPSIDLTDSPQHD